MNEQNYYTGRWLFVTVLLFLCLRLSSQTWILVPDRVFDGERMHEGWAVLVQGEYIVDAGPKDSFTVPADAQSLDLTGCTLLPGLIEGHSHLLLHPYNETSWNDQVLKESYAERVARAVVHAKATLEAGFITVRDLGTEGAGYADVGIKTAIEKGVIPGPRMIVAGPAIVATGSYGPKGFAPHVSVPLGAEEADGKDDLTRIVRRQIGNGVDVIKVYADYRWGPNGEARPTFTVDELKLIVELAASAGRPVVAHASTPEGMRRAIVAGVQTIEHGDGGTPELFFLMKGNDVALCPTLYAGYAISMYRGWNEQDPAPDRVNQKKKSFKQALQAGVTICAGGDAGVFAHGENARELELMVAYGMPAIDVLKSATSVNARVFGIDDKVGKVAKGLLADLLVVKGNPAADISDLRQVEFVFKGGELVRPPRPE